MLLQRLCLPRPAAIQCSQSPGSVWLCKGDEGKRELPELSYPCGGKGLRDGCGRLGRRLTFKTPQQAALSLSSSTFESGPSWGFRERKQKLKTSAASSSRQLRDGCSKSPRSTNHIPSRASLDQGRMRRPCPALTGEMKCARLHSVWHRKNTTVQQEACMCKMYSTYTDTILLY